MSYFHEFEGIELDYSPESLASMERVILRIRAEGRRSGSMHRPLYAFGAYVGEVIVRNNDGARWTYPPPEISDADPDPRIVGVTDANGVFWNPIGNAYKLLDNGREDSIVRFYDLVRQYRPEWGISQIPAWDRPEDDPDPAQPLNSETHKN